MTKKPDIYTRVTNRIIADLERGNLTWTAPWHAEHLASRIQKPVRHNSEPYQGINIILLWAASAERGFASNRWMTYRQAQALGGQVRKGEKGETVVYADTLVREDTDPLTGEDVETAIPFMKAYTVFNTDQIDALPDGLYPSITPIDPEIARLEAFFAGLQADIRHGGTRAYYALGSDHVHMPPLACFIDAERYYATLGHELTHWTRHPSRLDRSFGRKRWGDEGYAMEELVAEIGSAFLCADLGITPETREDHAAYIESWLTVLKNDKRAVFTAAAHAQRATAFLHARARPDTQAGANDTAAAA